MTVLASHEPSAGLAAVPALRCEVHQRVDGTWWDGLVASHPGGSIYQAVCWADFLAAYLRYRPLFIVARDHEGTVRATLLAFVRGLWDDLAFERPLGWALRPVLRRLLPVASWRYGPLWHGAKAPPAAERAFTQAVLQALAAEGIYAVQDTVSVPPNPSRTMEDPFRDVFSTARWQATLLVDVTPDPDRLWRSLKSSARKAIHSAQRAGVEVRRLTDLQELRAYDAFFRAHNVERAGRFYSFANLARMWEHLRPAGAVEVFAAWRGPELLAGLGVWRFGPTCVEFSTRQSTACREARIYAPDLIKWEIIRWAHAEGLRWYDLAGVAPAPASEKERGIRQFKEKWGGVYWEFAAREAILRPRRHRLVTGIRRAVRWARP